MILKILSQRETTIYGNNHKSHPGKYSRFNAQIMSLFDRLFQHRAMVFLFDFSPEQKFHGDDYLYSAKWSQNYSVSVVCWNRSRAWRIPDWRRWKSHLRGGGTEEDVEAVAEGGVDDWQSGTQLSETGERWGARCGRGGRKRVDIARATFFGLTLLGQHLLSWHYEGNICWMSPTLLPIYITAHI